ncbi:hypothetical protein ACFL6I_05760 [candidate division KSB1 bacterium]
MTEVESLTIAAINGNQYLSEELKKRYILALFLMESDKQQDFLRLMQVFNNRCREGNRGVFVVKASEINNTMRTYDDVKQDIFRKLDIISMPHLSNESR